MNFQLVQQQNVFRRKQCWAKFSYRGKEGQIYMPDFIPEAMWIHDFYDGTPNQKKWIFL